MCILANPPEKCCMNCKYKDKKPCGVKSCEKCTTAKFCLSSKITFTCWTNPKIKTRIRLRS